MLNLRDQLLQSGIISQQKAQEFSKNKYPKQNKQVLYKKIKSLVESSKLNNKSLNLDKNSKRFYFNKINNELGWLTLDLEVYEKNKVWRSSYY